MRRVVVLAHAADKPPPLTRFSKSTTCGAFFVGVHIGQREVICYWLLGVIWRRVGVAAPFDRHSWGAPSVLRALFASANFN